MVLFFVVAVVEASSEILNSENKTLPECDSILCCKAEGDKSSSLSSHIHLFSSLLGCTSNSSYYTSPLISLHISSNHEVKQTFPSLFCSIRYFHKTGRRVTNKNAFFSSYIVLNIYLHNTWKKIKSYSCFEMTLMTTFLHKCQEQYMACSRCLIHFSSLLRHQINIIIDTWWLYSYDILIIFLIGTTEH